jgi:hypothetical protein
MRLKASFDISGFPPNDQVILAALKQYGVMVADNGGAMFISGAPDERWANSELDQLKTLIASDFEVVLMGPVYTLDNVPTGPSPVVSSFTADPSTITVGEASTLSWSVTNAIYTIVSPEVGPMRETNVVVQPMVTTTYKLYATNQYGRSIRSVTVTVH